MYYYKLNDKYILSLVEQPALEPASEQELINCDDLLYYFISLNPEKSRRSFCVSESSLFNLKSEDLQLLQQQGGTYTLPSWLSEKVAMKRIKAINIAYPTWRECLEETTPSSWRINVVGLGDVGSTLLIGLKLLGGDKVKQIGIFDIDPNKTARWEFESSQILFPNNLSSPKVFVAKENELFDCDMFVFCVTVGIPALDSKDIDVRMAQFEGNSRIISLYAQKARAAGFKGIFAVVSDPVDLLCKKALLESNKDQAGNYDFKGLAPEQIRGYGLGVMNARAAYYAAQSEHSLHYLSEGRAFGPHGEHLVIANSIKNYDNELSLSLTEQARKANLELRKTGYKPYVAPALSSGAIAIMDTIMGNWHYSATYMGGVYMGAHNRFLSSGTELEQYDIPHQLMNRLNNSYKELESII